MFVCICIRFYRMRTERIEWFSARNPLTPKIAELLELGLFLPLETKDINNYQVFIIRTGVHDTKKHEQNDVFKVLLLMFAIKLLNNLIDFDRFSTKK